MFAWSVVATLQPDAGNGFLSVIGVPTLNLYVICPSVPEYSLAIEYTLEFWPLAAATSFRYFVMRFLYEEAIGVWPTGLQKMGVTVRALVNGVPMTAPPCQISGGDPFARSPDFVIARPETKLAHAAEGRAPMMPPMRPT